MEEAVSLRREESVVAVVLVRLGQVAVGPGHPEWVSVGPGYPDWVTVGLGLEGLFQVGCVVLVQVHLMVQAGPGRERLGRGLGQ